MNDKFKVGPRNWGWALKWLILYCY